MNNSRDLILDFTRGILIIIMVLYHSLDYFTNGSFLYKYISFVTGSFIFITGFIISYFYTEKYGVNSYKILFRLFERGIKLFLIFVLLNVIINLSFTENYGGRKLGIYVLLENLYPIFIYGSYKLAAFEILLPIAYLLILAGALIYIQKNNFWAYILVFFTLYIYCSIKFTYNQGAYNLRYITIGLFGLAIGFISQNRLRLLNKYAVIIVSLFASYVIFIKNFKINYPLYAIVVLINLSLIYSLGSKLPSKNTFFKNIVLLGKYSLFSYLVQIVILQVLIRVFSFTSVFTSKFVISFLITNLIMILIIRLTDFLRMRSVKMDKLYKIIFA